MSPSPPEYIRHILDEIDYIMRDRLIHDYFGVDYTIVWDVAATKLRPLRGQFQILLDLAEGRQQARAGDE